MRLQLFQSNPTPSVILPPSIPAPKNKDIQSANAIRRVSSKGDQSIAGWAIFSAGGSSHFTLGVYRFQVFCGGKMVVSANFPSLRQATSVMVGSILASNLV